MGATATRIGLGIGTMGMSELGGIKPLLDNMTPKAPKPPTQPAALTTETTAVQQAASEAAARRSKARGFRSTILSTMAGGGLKQTIGS